MAPENALLPFVAMTDHYLNINNCLSLQRRRALVPGNYSHPVGRSIIIEKYCGRSDFTTVGVNLEVIRPIFYTHTHKIKKLMLIDNAENRIN